MFDCVAWLKKYLPGSQLEADTIGTVSTFTLMWNLFEDLACDGRASVGRLDCISKQVSRQCGVPKAISEALDFWRARYGREDGSHELSGLCFRRNDRKEVVERVLGENGVTEDECNLAALLIVYRLRNNLFHGAKKLVSLSEQRPNLDTASAVLGAALLYGGFVEHKQEEVR